MTRSLIPSVGRAAPPVTAQASASAADLTFQMLLDQCCRSTWTSNPRQLLSFEERELSRSTEAFRELRSRLYRVREKEYLKTILIASAMPEEGRSFVAANLAQVLSVQPECKVLLIDADLRSSRQHSIFGTAPGPGLGEYLMDEANELEILQKGRKDDLFVVPAGRAVTGPAEMLAGHRFKSLIDRAAPLFDWILVDSPPAASLTDAGVIANCCDGILMVVRAKSTPVEIARKTRQKFREDQLIGVVLNEIESPNSPT